MQLEIERVSVARDEDAVSRDRLAKLDAELAELKEKGDVLRAQWQAEKQKVQQLRELREQIEQTKVQIEQAERAYDLNKAAELKYGKLHELERQLQAAEAAQAAAAADAGADGVIVGSRLVRAVAEEGPAAAGPLVAELAGALVR
jgi:ATP-dependent Clp protease ATP-binding subunit ClpB